jgi:RNA 3'-terminal phosphate cyclase
MDTNDPNFPIPILKLKQHGYPGSKAHHYRAAGRLVTTQMGGRTFVLKKDADAWLHGFPKVGNPGVIALQAAKQAVENLGHAVEQGLVEQHVAALAVHDVALANGLNRASA